MPIPNWAAGLGASLGGDSEAEYEKGRALGANTEDALAQARRRVMENDALARGRQTLIASGVPEPQADAAYTALQAGGKLDDPIQLMLKNQEFGFRNTAGDPNTTPGNANAALRGVASGPIEPLYKIGSGYASKFGDTDTVTPLPGGAREGGGQSSAMQYLAAAGALDANGLVRPGWERFAWRVQNPSQKTVMVGGVPTLVTDNPWEDAPGGSAPPPRAFGAGPPSAAAPVAPPNPRVSAQPLATAEQVAGNEAAASAAKAQAEAQGKNAASLPTALNTIDTFSGDIDRLLAEPGFNQIYGPRVGTDVGQAVTRFASGDSANAIAARNKINAESFRASINSMRGLGQLSNAEGEKVQAALTILADPHITPEKAREAAAQLKLHLAELKRVAQIEAGAGGQQSAAPPSAGRVKMIGGKKYVETAPGQWAEDDGA
jgi:hypothetical protein